MSPTTPAGMAGYALYRRMLTYRHKKTGYQYHEYYRRRAQRNGGNDRAQHMAARGGINLHMWRH
jgi:hypothetical protein